MTVTGSSNRLTLGVIADARANGQMPAGRIVYVGLGLHPLRMNGVAIDPNHIPRPSQCAGLVSLDVVILYRGNTTRYGSLRDLCESIGECQPRRLQAIDIDNKKIAFLKLGAK